MTKDEAIAIVVKHGSASQSLAQVFLYNPEAASKWVDLFVELGILKLGKDGDDGTA